VTGIGTVIGADNGYAGDECVGATLKRSQADAVAWVAAHQQAGGTNTA